MEEMLDVSFMNKIKSYIPRNMVEKIYKRCEASPSTSSARVEEIETAVEKEIPQEILELAVRSAVRQISEYILTQKFQNIRVYGRGEGQVLLLLKDNLRVEYEDHSLVNMSYNHSNSEDHASVMQLMGFPFWIDDKSNLQWEILHFILESGYFLLLVDGVDESIDLSEVLEKLEIPQNARCAIVFTTGSHEISPTMEVDVEINMEDHLLIWKLFCAIVGEFVHSSTVQHLAIAIFEKCCGQVLAVVLMAKYLRKNVTDVQSWEDALQELTRWSFQIQGMNRVIAKAMILNWKHMDNQSKCCVEYCASHPRGTRFNKVSLISDWIEDCIILTRDEGKNILEDLTCTFLLENIGKKKSVMMREEVYDIFMHLLVLNSDEPKDEEWNASDEDSSDEEWDSSDGENSRMIQYLMFSNLSEPPESPKCPVLLKLSLQGNCDLTEIPPSFFQHMPLLEVLDLSYTSITKLPHSLFNLVALRKFFLRGCKLFRYLPPNVGELKNLEELDLDETKIMYLPAQIGNLEKMTVLKVSFYGNMSGRQKIQQGAISNLSQLAELSIDVKSDDEQWDLTAEVIIEDVRRLTKLKSLILYMPKATLLDSLRWGSTTDPSLSHFRFIVGHHSHRIIPHEVSGKPGYLICPIVKKRIIDQVPHEVEAEFNKWDKCLKFVNGKNLPNEIKKVLSYATAFFLDRHVTITKLSEFGDNNMAKLKFCVMSECNQLQTIGEDEYSDDGYCTSSGLFLQYLYIYNMRNLVSIWRGRIGSRSLCCLKFLELHSCPRLSKVFTPDLIDNLDNLEELVIEDCPRVSYVLQSYKSHCGFESRYSSQRFLLPSLKRMALLYLPELVCINDACVVPRLDDIRYCLPNSIGLTCDYIAPNLEGIGVYNCPKLRDLFTNEFSGKNLNVLKGETNWYEALYWGWGGRHHVHVFSPINWMEEDVLTQMEKDGICFNIQKKTEILLKS